MEPLVDSWGRAIKSLRVSVTDKCNFRCTYCMPAEGLEWLPKQEVLSFEEIQRLVADPGRDGRGRDPPDRRRAARPPRLAHARRAPRRRRPGPTISRSRRTGSCSTAWPGRSSRPASRRLNVSLDSLSHVRFAEITPPRRARQGPARARGGGALSASSGRSRSTVSRSAGSPRRRSPRSPSSRAASRTSSASSSSCRWTPTRPGTATRS